MNPVDVPTADATKNARPGAEAWGIGVNGFVVADGAALPLRDHESFVPLDTSDLASFRSACEGVHTVVHLAADPRPSADFHTSLLPANVVRPKAVCAQPVGGLSGA